MHSSFVRLTKRLKNSLLWFLTLLQGGAERHISLTRLVSIPNVLLCSDADGNGGVGGALALPDGTIRYVQRLLKRRRTNITGYDLLASLAAIVVLHSEHVNGCCLIHFIDNIFSIGMCYSRLLQAGRSGFDC